jgi:starch phosphorylase
MQQHCIAMNGSFFNTDRMLAQYFANAYFPDAPAIDESPAGEQSRGELAQ